MKDLLGVKPFGKAIQTVSAAACESAQKYLDAICLPAAQELGGLFHDQVRHWRAANAVHLVNEAAKKTSERPTAEGGVHPRVAGTIIERGSWSDDDHILSWWGGLLASARNEGNASDEDIIFVNLLSELTASQAAVLDYTCKRCQLGQTDTGFAMALPEIFSVENLLKIANHGSIKRLDRELDGLSRLEVMRGRFMSTGPIDSVPLAPTPLGIYLYLRCEFGLVELDKAIPDHPTWTEAEVETHSSERKIVSTITGNYRIDREDEGDNNAEKSTFTLRLR